MQRYSAVAAFFHWLSVALVLGLFYTGYMFHQVLERGTDARGEMFTWHKTIGIALLIAAVLRLVHRLVSPPPTLPESLPARDRTLAAASHWLFYLLIIGIPLTGLIKVSPDDGSTELVGGLSFPTIPGVSESLSELMGELHEKIVWAFLLLIVVHVMAALYHHGRGTAAAGRMWPAR